MRKNESRQPAGFATAAPEITDPGTMTLHSPSTGLPATELPDEALEWIRRVRKGWRIVAGTIVAALLLALLAIETLPKRYEATVLAAVTPAVEALAAEEVLRGVDTLERRTLVATIAALASTSGTRTMALKPDSPAGGEYTIDAIVLPNTSLVEIHVTGGDRKRVAPIANRVPALLSAHARTMYGLYRVTTISQAAAPERPITPRVGRIVAAGLMLGTILGIMLAYAFGPRQLATAR